MDKEIQVKRIRQNKLERTYKFVLSLILLIVVAAIVAIFAQIYSINSKINSEVKQISASQARNHDINNQQNSIILGYLICIGTIQPADRTPAVINACVAHAKNSDSQFTQ